MALDAYLILTPAPGVRLVGAPSPDPRDPGGVAVAVTGFDFGVADPAIVGGGGGRGSARYGPLVATRAVDGTSPALLALVGSGTPLPRMELYVREPAGGAEAGAALVYDFRTVVVTDLAWSGPSDAAAVTEQITFHYRSLDDLRTPPAPVATPSQTATQTPTATSTQTPTSTTTSTQTPTATSTQTPTATGTGTPTQAPTATGTATGTPVPGTGGTIPPDGAATPEAGSAELLAAGGVAAAAALLGLRRRGRGDAAGPPPDGGGPSAAPDGDREGSGADGAG